MHMNEGWPSLRRDPDRAICTAVEGKVVMANYLWGQSEVCVEQKKTGLRSVRDKIDQLDYAALYSVRRGQ